MSRTSWAVFRITKPLPTASFTISAVDPKKTRSLIFLHPEKKLVKTMELQGNEPGPLTVRLEPAGTVTGRLLDADGQPLAKVDLRVLFDRKDNDYGAAYFPERVATDGEGRFRVDGLAPGLVYQIDVAGKPPQFTVASVAGRISVKSGETRNFGDIKAKPHQE